MSRKLRVAILFEGKSAEHEVSLQSARNVVQAMDKRKYDTVLIGIDKHGSWHLSDASQYLLNAENPKMISLNAGGENVALVTNASGERELVNLQSQQPLAPVDVVFPILHGPFGEDGTIQGLLKLMGVPFVGASVLGSAVGMDKDVMKRLLRDAGLPVSQFMVIHKHQSKATDYGQVTAKLGLPMFVKPANMGSSVGIHKVTSAQDLRVAVSDALRYDKKVILEENVAGREIECSVIGNDDPLASLPGEIIPHHEFYSYEAKYIDEDGAGLQVQAQLSDSMTKAVQELSVRTFQVLCCEGMARVDTFLTADDRLFVNEINTIPGFTKISMFPKLWEESGLSPTALIDRLIELALERFEKERALRTSIDL